MYHLEPTNTVVYLCFVDGSLIHINVQNELDMLWLITYFKDYSAALVIYN
jgi:hypothetical protein